MTLMRDIEKMVAQTTWTDHYPTSLMIGHNPTNANEWTNYRSRTPCSKSSFTIHPRLWLWALIGYGISGAKKLSRVNGGVVSLCQDEIHVRRVTQSILDGLKWCLVCRKGEGSGVETVSFVLNWENLNFSGWGWVQGVILRSCNNDIIVQFPCMRRY